MWFLRALKGLYTYKSSFQTYVLNINIYYSENKKNILTEKGEKRFNQNESLIFQF